MTTDPSSILDPVTGLPLDQFSGIIQQIPLGQQVFPLADLNADGRMTRQPIYGDDVLPTSALVVGMDTDGQPRAGTMDTARRLYTREAVFQNLGAPIPDGETAPVDVNVVSGGGGGGGAAWGYATGYYTEARFNAQYGQFDTIKPAPAKLYAISIHAFAVGMSTSSGGYWGPFTFGYGAYSESLLYPLFTGMFSYDPTIPQMINAQLHYDMAFPDGLPILGTYSNANPFTIWIDCTSFNTQVTYSLLYV